MGRRRHVSVSDDEDEEPGKAAAKPSQSSSNDGDDRRRRRNEPRNKRRRRMKFDEDEEEEEEMEQDREESGSGGNDEEDEEEEEERVQEDAKPIGDPLRVTGKGRWKTSHFAAFEFDGNRFELEDPVLLTPEDGKQKPYVAIIKDITQGSKEGGMMVTGQWFYRPEEAEKKGGGSWQPRDTRELFYSFHRDDVPAESVMHKCVVHFVPLHKQLPRRKQFPGFIVQKVYDTEQRKLFKLTDKDYEDSKQHEIDLLVNKTMARLGDLPDLDAEDTPPLDQEEQAKSKKLLRKRNLSPIDVSKEDEGAARSDQHIKTETPGSVSKYYTILANFGVLTKEAHRDKCLEKLLQCVEYVCSPSDSVQEKETSESVDSKNLNGDKPPSSSEAQEKGAKADILLKWPDSAVSAVTALEKASNEASSLDSSKYNQTFRKLLFNLKHNAFLARRLLKGELDPRKILSMSHAELKDGLTAEEIDRHEPEESARMQMTDARCEICLERKVGIADIIQTGNGDRYQLECIACGNTWYASRDESAMLTINGPSVVNTTPTATAKSESTEKKLASPHEPEKANALKKPSEAAVPVLETQKSFNKAKTPEDSTITSVSPKKPE